MFQEGNMDWQVVTTNNKRKGISNNEDVSCKKTGMTEHPGSHHTDTKSAESKKVKGFVSSNIKHFQEKNKGPYTV